MARASFTLGKGGLGETLSLRETDFILAERLLGDAVRDILDPRLRNE